MLERGPKGSRWAVRSQECSKEGSSLVRLLNSKQGFVILPEPLPATGGSVWAAKALPSLHLTCRVQVPSPQGQVGVRGQAASPLCSELRVLEWLRGNRRRVDA